jgi:hypothetical protein
MPKIWSLDWWWNNGVIFRGIEVLVLIVLIAEHGMVHIVVLETNKSIVYEMIMGMTILMEFSFKGWDKWGVRRRPWPALLEHCESKFKCFGEYSIECFHGTWSLGNPWFWDMWNVSKDRRHLNYSSIWTRRGTLVFCALFLFLANFHAVAIKKKPWKIWKNQQRTMGFWAFLSLFLKFYF